MPLTATNIITTIIITAAGWLRRRWQARLAGTRPAKPDILDRILQAIEVGGGAARRGAGGPPTAAGCRARAGGGGGGASLWLCGLVGGSIQGRAAVGASSASFHLFHARHHSAQQDAPNAAPCQALGPHHTRALTHIHARAHTQAHMHTHERSPLCRRRAPSGTAPWSSSCATRSRPSCWRATRPAPACSRGPPWSWRAASTAGPRCGRGGGARGGGRCAGGRVARRCAFPLLEGEGGGSQRHAMPCRICV